MRSMTDAVAIAVMPARIAAIVTGAFGLLGALLATLGVYGLISYIVLQRSREVAIRRAVGAQTSHILRMIGGSSLGLTLMGLALGLSLVRCSRRCWAACSSTYPRTTRRRSGPRPASSPWRRRPHACGRLCTPYASTR